jgi:hypothetical protein
MPSLYPEKQRGVTLENYSRSLKTPIACALKQTDIKFLTGCAAAAYLNPEQRRLVSCAFASQSYFEFGICASGIQLNREWAVAVKCIGMSGGQPLVAAGCTTGPLTINEVEKCKRGIGTDDGCFGPNNTIISAFSTLETAIKDSAIQSNPVLLESVQIAQVGSRQMAQSAHDLIDALDACAKNPAACPAKARDFCQSNPIVCAAGFPILYISAIHLQSPLNLPPLTPLPAPPCQLQWKCDGLRCSNMC